MNEFEKLKKEADQNYLSRNFDKAIELYKKCQELDAEHLIVRSNEATCYLEKEEYTKALEILEEAEKVY